MTRGQFIVLVLGAAWLAFMSLLGLNWAAQETYSESWEAAFTVAGFTILAVFPLALAVLLYKRFGKDENLTSKKAVRLLSVPWWMAAGGALIALIATALVESPSGSSPGTFTARPGSGALEFLAHPSPSIDVTKADSLLAVENLTFEKSRSLSGQESLLISGVARNVSDSTLTIGGYTAYFLSAKGDAVADTTCRVRRNWFYSSTLKTTIGTCGFAHVELSPGYVTDFEVVLDYWPSVARTDTARLLINLASPSLDLFN